MKKSLIALAVLAASGAAMAQSSVTIFGIVDVGVGHLSATNSVSGVTQSGNSSSRLGFRGVEDLGGGLKAGFWLEGAISPDTGTGAGGSVSGADANSFKFARRSTISLAGGFGEVRLGRELAVGYDKPSSYDPFGQVGFASLQNFSVVRVSNGVSYRTPANLGGFWVAGHYGFGEQTSSSSAGRYLALAGGYDNGPLSITVAGDQLKEGGIINGYGGAAVVDNLKSFSAAASYDLGIVKPAVVYRSERGGTVVDAKTDSLMLALTAPLGSGRLIGYYARYDNKRNSNDANALAVGYVYDLSKRTAVYGTYAHLNNKNNSTRGLPVSGLSAVTVGAGENVDGYQVGIRHAF